VAVDFCIAKILENVANTAGCMAHLCLRK